MKKFIPLLLTIIIVIILNSCSKDDEMFIDIPKQEESRPKKSREISDKRDLGYSIFPIIVIDSSTVSNNQDFDSAMFNETQQNSEDDPPVKNGNHWKNGN